MIEDGAIERGAERVRETLRVLTPPVVMGLILANVVVFFMLPIAFSSRYPYHLESIGTAWGPLVFGGQWWRLLTCFFVHFEFSHLFPNMLALWIFGTILERELGGWVFLFFYLACGLIVSLSGLALHPFMAPVGASGAVAGAAGGTIATYAPRFTALSRGTKGKLTILAIYVAGLVTNELIRGDLVLPHTTGLMAGIFLGVILVYFAKTKRSRYWTFSAIALLLVIAAIPIRQYHR
jgi:rhomboid protease GluP